MDSLVRLMDSLAGWLAGTALSRAVLASSWAWIAGETLHFIGMALLIGIVGLLDLRMLGMVKGLALRPLLRLLPWAVLGFVINAATGVSFVAAQPSQYLYNIAFWLKMLFIAVAGLNVLFFYVTGLSARVDAVGSDQDVARAAKVVAAVSLFLWVGVIYWGRMLPWIGEASRGWLRP